MLPKIYEGGKETVFKLGNIAGLNEIVYVCFYEHKNFYKQLVCFDMYNLVLDFSSSKLHF